MIPARSNTHKKLSEILLRDFEVGFLLIEIMKFFNLKLRISLKKIIIIEKRRDLHQSKMTLINLNLA